jgi:flagellar biosynthesis GTPase FlhF
MLVDWAIPPMDVVPDNKPKIFLSYRREDTQYAAGQIAWKLQSHFGDEAVIFDVDALAPGRNFEEQIDREVRTCDFFIAVMGRSWLTVRDKEERRKLDDPLDWVRRETELALGLDIPVIPLLLDHISMPSADELPECLKKLTLRHAETIHPHPQYFKLDLERLIQKIEHLHKKIIEERQEAAEEQTKREIADRNQKLVNRIQELADRETEIRESLAAIHERRERQRSHLEAEERRLHEAHKRFQEQYHESQEELNQQEHRLHEETKRAEVERAAIESRLLRESANQDLPPAASALATFALKDRAEDGPPLSPVETDPILASNTFAQMPRPAAATVTREESDPRPSEPVAIQATSRPVVGIVTPEFSVLWPGAKSYLVAGGTETIHWKASDPLGAQIERFEISLETLDPSDSRSSTSATRQIRSAEAPLPGITRSYTWRVPADLPISKFGFAKGESRRRPTYQIRVDSFDSLGVGREARSDPFVVIARVQTVWIVRVLGALLAVAISIAIEATSVGPLESDIR